MAGKSRHTVRSKSKKRKRARRYFILGAEGLFLAGLLGGFIYMFLQYSRESSQFQVHNVQIDGLRVLDEDSVLIQSGIRVGENVLYFKADEVQKRIESMPYVKSCDVSQIFPDTVVLRITERVALVTLQLNSRSYAVDDAGVVLREYDNDELPITPYVTNVDGLEFIEPGVQIDLMSFRSALQVWLDFRITPMAQDVTVSELAATNEDYIQMICDELSFVIRWKHGESDRQAKRLNVLWLKNKGEMDCLEYLDLRFDSDLICK